MGTSQTKRVLVVDDERINATTLVEVLKNADYDASAVHTVQEALVWCRAHHPDAVITEAIVGRMDGIELAIHIIDTIPTCKLLIFSGDVTTGDVILGALRRGYKIPVVAKPCHPREILEVLAGELAGVMDSTATEKSA